MKSVSTALFIILFCVGYTYSQGCLSSGITFSSQSQIDNFQKGLLKAVLDKDEANKVIRKAGVMGIVVVGGEVRPTDAIVVDLPPEPHQPLEYVW